MAKRGKKIQKSQSREPMGFAVLPRPAQEVKSLPKVSICTVTYNRAKFLPLLQQHILRQAYPRELLEWIILDDSDDGKPVFEPDFSQGLTIRYERLPAKVTLGKKRNLSHTFCTGEIIVYMDDDDFYPPTRVSHAVERLLGSVALVAGCTTLPILFLPERELWMAGPYGNNHATAGTFAFKRKLIYQSRYDETKTRAEESSFLKGYRLSMVQLEPEHTIICIAHDKNTFEKRKLKNNSSPKFCQASPEVHTSLHSVHGEALKAYAALIEQSAAQRPALNQPTINNQTLPYPKRQPIRSQPFSHAYCISLEDAKQRQARLTKHLSEQQLQLVCFKATRPETLPPIHCDIPIFNRPKQLACLASHLRLLHAIGAGAADDNHSFLILEDDVILHPNFQSKLLDVQLPGDWEIIQLGTSHQSSTARLLALAGRGVAFIRWEQIFWGCQAYIIKAKAAKRLANTYLPEGKALDFIGLHRPTACVPDFLLYEDATTYSLCEPLATFDTNCPSQIGYQSAVDTSTAEAAKIILESWKH